MQTGLLSPTSVPRPPSPCQPIVLNTVTNGNMKSLGKLKMIVLLEVLEAVK